MKLGKLLGTGMTAEVYELNNETVVKLFYVRIPKDWIHYEFSLAKPVGIVYENAPKALEVVKIEGRLGIVYERAYGIDLSELIVEDTSRSAEFGKALAELQFQLHNIKSNDLPQHKDRLINSIKESSVILGQRFKRLLEMVEEVVFQNYICHGDLHLGNIMLHEETYTVIDWMNTSIGTPIADVCRTILMLDSPYSVEVAPNDVKPIVEKVMEEVKSSYLETYFNLSKDSYDDIKIWMPLVAGARLSEHIPGEEKWLIKMIDEYMY